MIFAYLSLAALSAAMAAPDDRGCTAEALKKAVTACDAAIVAEADPAAKAVLLHLRAYAWNERRRPDKALADLNEALRLAPGNAETIHERAYTLAELGEFERALADSDREVRLRPDEPRAYRERGFIRLARADFAGAYADAVQETELSPQDWGARLERAEAALWEGRFDEAAAQIEAAERLAAAGDSEAREAVAKRRMIVQLWRKRSAAEAPGERCREAFNTATVDQPDVIGDCSAAFLAAPTAARKAEYLTYRSVAWAAGQQDSRRYLIDGEVAAALDPGNPDMLVNIGGLYNSVGRFHAAVQRLDRAIAAKPSYPAFTARAVARRGLGDSKGAREDAEKSMEIEPNMLAYWVLGDLARDEGDAQEAKRLWMAAFRLGARDDRLMERLKSVGVADPAQESESE